MSRGRVPRVFWPLIKMKLHLFSKLIVIWFSISLLLGTGGCAHKYTLPPSEDLRSNLGTVGIVYGNKIPESNFNTFAKGRLTGTGKGVAGGAAGGAAVGAAIGIAGGPIGFLLFPVLTGGGAVIGGVAGGVAGTAGAVSKSEAEKIETAINNALSALRVQETMAGHMVRASRALVDYRFYPEPVLSEATPDHGFLKGKGIDTAMEVFVEGVGFEGGSGSDPAIAFFMNIRERLVRTSDGSVLYENKLIYRSAKRKFSLWSKNNAEVLSAEFDRAYQGLAEKVVEETFLRYDPSRPANTFLDRL